ncbi:hypothetical protein C5S32_07890 [ANME-1 cluster archaeon GoMg1]|nr:hypothetical protein [ANME-1 cluster archaeon GoMg1]
MNVFGGNIIDQREDAVEFVKEHIKLLEGEGILKRIGKGKRDSKYVLK